MIEFEVAHTADGVKAVYEEMWRRRFGLAYRLLLGTLTLLFVAVLAFGELPRYLLAAICIVVVVVVMLRMTRDSTIAIALEYFESVGRSTYKFRIDEVGVTEDSAIGRVHLQWRAFAGFLELGDFLLLIRAPESAGLFVALPRAQLPDAARQLVESRLTPV